MSAATRAHGEGSIHQTADGRWWAQIPFIDPKTGKRKLQRLPRKTKKEARVALDELNRRAAAGQPLRDSGATIAAWSHHWEATTLAVSERRETTKLTYRTLSKTLIRPYLGAVTLDKLRPSDVEGWLAQLAADGKSASTRRQALTILRSMLTTAVRDGVIARNVALEVTRPTLRRTEAKSFDASSVRALVAAAADDRLKTLLVVLLGTGMRRGEAIALQWENVDVDAGELRVRGTLVRTGDGLVIQPPKTGNGWRSIPLSPPVVAALKQQRQQQRLERLAAGVSWVATDYVFTTVAGTPLDPRNVSRWFSTLAKRAGVEGSMHATRHTALSSMVNAGVPMPVVSRVAGHESINITVDIYGHVSEQAARDAVAAAASSLGL